MSLSGTAAIVGAYESPMRKSDGVHPYTVLQECVKGALDDAGLTIADVDGLAAARPFVVHVQRVEVARQTGERDDVGLGDRPCDGCERVAD